MRILFLGYLLGLGFLFWGCNRNEVIEIGDKGYDFFPLKVGSTWVYAIDSIIYDPTVRGVVVDTNYVQVRETITDSYLDGEGQEVFILERAERLNETDTWRIKDVWTSYNTPREAVRIEENLSFIKLLFPVEARQIWDTKLNIANEFVVSIAGETINIFKNWNSEVIHLDTVFTLNNNIYNPVVVVSLADSENLIEYRWGREYYAKGIGLIYRELRVLDTQKIDPNTAWENKAEKGFIVKQRLLRYN